MKIHGVVLVEIDAILIRVSDLEIQVLAHELIFSQYLDPLNIPEQGYNIQFLGYPIPALHVQPPKHPALPPAPIPHQALAPNIQKQQHRLLQRYVNYFVLEKFLLNGLVRVFTTHFVLVEVQVLDEVGLVLAVVEGLRGSRAVVGVVAELRLSLEDVVGGACEEQSLYGNDVEHELANGAYQELKD